MADYTIFPSRLQGEITIPSSKSHTLRAILFAAMAKGRSIIHCYLSSPDTEAMIAAVRLLGAHVKVSSSSLEIEGCAGTPLVPSDVIQCGNSGQVLRFVGAISALTAHYTLLTGDTSIRENRPVIPLLDALSQLGATALSSRGNGCAPILIKGPIKESRAVLDGQDSQPVSGLLIAAAFAPHPIELFVENPGETPWIDLTLDWFRRLNIPYKNKEYSHYQMQGRASIEGFEYTVPGDFSTAAFPIAAALLTDSELTLHNIDMTDVQGDKALIPLLEKMGARFTVDSEKHTLFIHKGCTLQGTTIDVNAFIDALPILAVICCFSQGTSALVNGQIARRKESDRITAIATELRKMGALIEEKEDGLIIHPHALSGTHLHTYDDHRIALSLSVACMAAQSESQIEGVECIEKTYPDFAEEWKKIGAWIE